jgi:hypothetical protein
MLRILVLAALFAFTGVTLVAEPASAGTCEAIVEPPVGQNSWHYACGRANCLIDGLPNIMVTCL